MVLWLCWVLPVSSCFLYLFHCLILGSRCCPQGVVTVSGLYNWLCEALPPGESVPILGYPIVVFLQCVFLSWDVWFLSVLGSLQPADSAFVILLIFAALVSLFGSRVMLIWGHKVGLCFSNQELFCVCFLFLGSFHFMWQVFFVMSVSLCLRHSVDDGLLYLDLGQDLDCVFPELFVMEFPMAESLLGFLCCLLWGFFPCS